MGLSLSLRLHDVRPNVVLCYLLSVANGDITAEASERGISQRCT